MEDKSIESVEPDPLLFRCEECGNCFPKRNALFKHLRVHGVFPMNEVKYVKIAMLVGWISNNPDGDTQIWVKDGSLSYDGAQGLNSALEKSIWEAIKKVEGILPEDEAAIRPKGFTRASSCAMRGTEDSCHGLADVFSMQLKDNPIRVFDTAWVAAVNALLPEHIIVHEVYLLPNAGSMADFHAEISCTQRVYEYMFPLGTLLRESDNVARASEKLVAVLNGYSENNYSTEDFHFIDENFCAVNDADISELRKKKGKRTNQWTTKNPRNTMGEIFPAETESSSKRIKFFRNLKVLFKKLGGQHHFHNFAAGGASPDDLITVRRLDRTYHREVVELDPLAGEGCKEFDHQEIVSNLESLPTRKENDYKNIWAVFSISGDSFLRGQIRHMLGLAVCVMMNWLPLEYFYASLSGDTVLEVPSLPGFPMMLSECRYDRWEAKFNMKLDPRRDVGRNLTSISSWKHLLRRRIAGYYYSLASDSSAESDPLTSLFLGDLQNKCMDVCTRYFSMLSLQNRPNLPEMLNTIRAAQLNENIIIEGEKSDDKVTSLMTIAPLRKDYSMPPVYGRVLQLLREADQSGLWPASSQSRQKYIHSECDDRSALPVADISSESKAGLKLASAAVAAESKLKESAAVGGSFSIGVYPPPLLEPKGNALFPELLVACFQLERCIAPHRPPSSTIAVNRHAQFKPHRDSGAGNGQCKSLIVGLGDYAGGETVTENVVHDIRYKPLEFDGWNERHWTLPFIGERYSLVWFTPYGVTESDMFWLKDPEFHKFS